MIEVLKISDMEICKGTDGGAGSYLALDLQDLLPLVADEGPLLQWAGIPMGESAEIIFRDDPQAEEAKSFFQRVDESDAGILCTWEYLCNFSRLIVQTEWATFVGVRDEKFLEDIPSLFLDDWRYVDGATARFYEIVEIAFQAIDASYWLVYAKDAVLRERIRGAFTSVQSVPGMSLYKPETGSN